MLSEAVFYRHAAYSNAVIFFSSILFMNFQSIFRNMLMKNKILTWCLSPDLKMLECIILFKIIF